MLQTTSPARFERLAAEVGEPARATTLPEPAEPDVAKLLAVVPKCGTERAPPAARRLRENAARRKRTGRADPPTPSFAGRFAGPS